MQQRISTSISLTALLSFICLIAVPSLCRGLENPAAGYCRKLGYQYISKTDASGNDNGFCLLPDNTRPDAWNFFQGKVGQKYSYCAGKGFQTETRTQFISPGFSTQSAVCVQPSSPDINPGNEIKLLDLMQSQGDGFIRTSPQRTTRMASRTKEEFTEIPIRELPQTFDWRDQDSHSYIGPVRDQGGCGDCYAFGAAAAAEAAYNIYHNKYDDNTIDFSESYIAWCLGTYGPYSEHFSGCDGADYEYAELEALTSEGITLERYFPYTEEDPGSCTHQDKPVAIFSDWGRIPPNDIAGIKNAIIRYGVLDAAILAPAEFIFYSGGIYGDELTGCPEGAWTETNHAVALVGWGHDTVQGDYWILRNSWGTGWGVNGYMKIQMTAARVACSSTYLTYTGEDDNLQIPLIPALHLLLK